MNLNQFTVDQIKIAKRLAYLLTIREQDFLKYTQGRYGLEKETIYVQHPEVVPLALQIYNGRIKV